MRKKFIGLSKSNNGDWKVHQQYHSPRLPIGIKSRPGKYFIIKEEDSGIYQAIAEKLREKEISCEVFLEEGKLTKQYMLAEKKGAKWLIIADKKEEGTLTDNLTLRNLEKRENLEALSLDVLVNILKSKRFVC